jgi:ribonuclease HI
LTLSASKKRKAAEHLAAFIETGRPALEAFKCKVRMFGAVAHVTSPDGRVFSLLTGSGIWHEHVEKATHHRSGVEGLVEYLGKAPTPPAGRYKGKRRPLAENPPMVTIFTDASYRANHTGGWGAWVKGGPGRGITGNGPLLDVPTSTEAEMRAIANGLGLAIARGIVQPGALVMLQSDCAAALASVLFWVEGARDAPAEGGITVPKPRRQMKSLRESAAMRVLIQQVGEYSLQIRVRHVRGHDKGLSTRSAVNVLTDRLAREGAGMVP